MRKRGMLAAVSAGVMVASLAACGGDDGGSSSNTGGGGGDGSKYILGTTESVTAMDPAGSYDFGSWNMQYAIFQQLMTINANETEPVADAASCDYDDPQTVTCKLTSGLKFSNGDELTSSDVLFSFKRNIDIADPNGSAVLLGQLTDKDGKFRADSIETPDDTTVTFHLNTPDTTFLKLLSTATTSIVDEDVFPADKLLDDDKVIGSGPLKLSQYKPGEQAVLEANASYKGEKKSKSSQIFVQYFKDPAPLKEAIKTGQVDIAWRTLSPTDLQDLKDNSNAQVLEGGGAEFRYWVFQLGTATGKQKAVRQAVAQLIDRDAITQDAYDGTTAPAYSIVPPGFGGQKDSFKEKYGAAPDTAKAKQILSQAGVKTPVDLTIGWTPTHYGPNLVDEAKDLSDQLNESGLFKVALKSAEWEQYQTLYKKNAYDLFALGWYPDILDADNYLTPFIKDGGFFANGYSNPEVNKLLEQELAETDTNKRDEIIGQLQDIAAEDVPYIPSWFGKNVAVAGPGMQGVKETLDPTYIFRLWTISKSS
ncbi:ABC transporter substrate-binding protein [Nocardioides marmoribigeumensis]|uniref:Peptide/nickel transport system substrate-binding protein n=1 Tax=Nocardioides marmoribigeumensis TaxID=433649 RepID=A0ABU2C167_9ACTN|nr:ABC transporter substrate-binding protein [Nocardioides marmoribigeumensis]MDR7364409.1 peptide/nickel transport system substrate-binding protein [Nocardioides marmoribigeumensis]